MAIADRLAAHLTSLRYEDLPDDVVRAAKRLILDTLGTARAGAGEPGCAEVAAALAADGGAPQSTIWSSGRRTTAGAAALINGTCAAALDYDSLHFEGVIHPEIVTLPAALALAEREGRSGRDLILAVVAGGDLMCRMAMSTGRNGPWFVTSTNGTFGAAAAAGIMLGLDAAAMRNALGLALCQAGGTVQAVLERTLAKRIQSALAARNGILAAELARHGVTGPAESFEGPGGYYAAFERGDPAILLDGLGSKFETANVGIKKYPSCACNHAAIEAAYRLIEANRIRPQDVEQISVRITPFMNQIVGAPFDPSDNPQVAAQFSVQYSVACVVERGHLGLDDLTAERARDPDVLRLARRVQVEVDEGANGFLAPATVRIDAAGRRFEETVRAVPGSAEAPLSDSEVLAKFRACLNYGPASLSVARTEALADAVGRLETIDSLGDFFTAAAAA